MAVTDSSLEVYSLPLLCSCSRALKFFEFLFECFESYHHNWRRDVGASIGAFSIQTLQIKQTFITAESVKLHRSSQKSSIIDNIVIRLPVATANAWSTDFSSEVCLEFSVSLLFHFSCFIMPSCFKLQAVREHFSILNPKRHSSPPLPVQHQSSVIARFHPSNCCGR